MQMEDELLHVNVNGRDAKHVITWEVEKHVFAHGGVNAYGSGKWDYMHVRMVNGIKNM